MDSLAPAETFGERPKSSDLLKPESSNKSLIIPDSDAEEEKSKTPLADTNFGGTLDEALSLRSQLYSLQVDDAISLCISILRSSIAINGINDDTIAEQVRIALRYLTKLPDPEPDNKFALDKFVYEYSGLDALVELIRQPNLVIALDAIRALYRVASVDNYTNLAVDASVPKTVVDILSNAALIADNRTVCDGLLLLGNMAFNAEARAAIGEHRGVKVILNLLRNNRSNVEIADQCCYALANLAVSSHSNSQTMVDGNAIDEIIRIMSMHSRDVQLLESATFVLTNLCTDGEQPRMQIVSAGGGRILGQVLHNHANVPRLMKAVLRTLGNLACSALAVSTLVKDGLIPILMDKVHNQTAVRELELVVLVLSNMAIEGDQDTLAQLASPDGDVLCRLLGMCSHPTILMVVVGLIDTLITRYEAFAGRPETWDMLVPLLVQSLPVLSQPCAALQHDLLAAGGAGAGQEGTGAPEDGLERLERLRLESVQHVYHAVGMLAATSSTTKDHNDQIAVLRSDLYTTLDEAAEAGSASGPVLDCAIQAIWCLARLTTRISYMEIERDQVVTRLLRLFGVLIGLVDNHTVNTEIWAAVGGILRVLAQLATLHRSICSYISRYSMPAITRAFIMFTERKPQPDPETSAAFAGLLACMTSTTTSLVHLGVDLAEAICRLLQTATNEDGTLTVASAASFIVLLSKMAANDRRGNIRAALNPSVLMKVMKALQSSATSQFKGADQTSIHDLIEACQSLQIVLDAPSLQAPSPTSTAPLTPVRNIRSIPKKTFLQIVHSPTSAQESVRRASQIVNPTALVASVKVQQRYRRRSSAMFNPRRKTSSDMGELIPERADSLGSLSYSDHLSSEHLSSGRNSTLEPCSRLWASILDECGSSADRLRAHSRIQEIVVQNGIPDMYRAQVWRTLSGSDDLRRCFDADYYTSLVKIVEEHGSPAQTEIRKDIRRTLPFTDLFKTETGVQKLERVLSAYCLRNSETVGYCQSMNNLCGALLTILSEEDSFWVLSCMIETRVGYYCKSMCALLRDQLVLKDLLSFHQPLLYDHLLAHGVNIDTFTVSWFLCLFMEAPVPFSETMMLWDAILLFGDEMIFLFALEIFKRCSAQILELKSESELLVYFLRGLPHDIPSVQTMLGAISVGSISARVAILREVHEKTVAANCMQIRPSTLLNVEDHHYYDFSESELAQLWKAFLSPSPWHILLHASIPNSTWLQYALKQVVFDTTSSLWRDHGLVSGLMDRLFVVADTNRTSHIDFEEFLVVAHILLKGTNEMRMQFAFAFADRDEDEMVSKKELYDMVVMLEATYNGWETAEAGAEQFVESVFDSAETSVTALDIDEFCHFALVHPLIASFFKLQAGVVPARWTR